MDNLGTEMSRNTVSSSQRRDERIGRRRPSSLEAALAALVHAFVEQISNVARRAAIGHLELAFGGAPVRPDRLGAAIRIGSRGGRPRGSRNPKRTAADLRRLATTFLSFVQAYPGLRIEQINERIGTTTYELALPIRKLVADGQISPQGAKRSTRYFVAAARSARS